MTMPAVQNPHWSACDSWNAAWTGCSSSPCARPSIVVISDPSAWAASIVHDFTDSPSTSTVHAPHDDVSHPIFVPVRPTTSRRYCTSSKRGSTIAADVLDLERRLACADRDPSAGVDTTDDG